MIKAKKKESIKETSVSSKSSADNMTATGKVDIKPANMRGDAEKNDPKQPPKVPTVLTALDMWVPPKKRRRTHTREDEETYPVQPNIIHIVTKPRTYVNHTYRDFSCVPLHDGSTKLDIPQDVSQMSFYMKVYHLISTKVEPSNSSIEWCNHGRAFRIVHVERLEYRLQQYFGYNRLSKFRKQLLDNGFKMITEGRDSGCYYSEFLLRGLPHLTQYAPEPVERRKLLPDPENEPDFYEITQLFPLPDDQANQLEEARAELAKRGIFLANDTPTLPSPQHRITTASVLAQMPSRATNLGPLASLRELPITTMNSIGAARLSAAARMQEMSSNFNRISNANLPLYYGLTGFGDRLSSAGLNPVTLRNSHLSANGFNPLAQNYQNTIANLEYERLRSSLGLRQLLAEQQSRDRMSTYLHYLNSQGDDDTNVTSNPFNEYKQP